MPQNYTKLKGTEKGIQRFSPDPKKMLFNIDTLWYTYDALNYDEVMSDGFLNKLETGKKFAEEGFDKLAYVLVKLDRYAYPMIFEIQPKGQAPHYSFIIRNHDMAFYFARKRRESNFPIKVQINQFKLWEMGVHDAYQESLYVLADLGFIYEAAKPNRIDPCIHSDQFDWRFEDFRTFNWPRNIAMDNDPNFMKLNPYADDDGLHSFGTVYFGSRQRCMLRIYNKSKEIKAKQKDYFRTLYESRGMNPDKVWNVEFEVHRDYLKGLANSVTGETNIFDSMDNLLRYDGLSLLWSHLMDEFSHDSAFWKIIRKGDTDKFIDCKNFVFRLKDIDSSKMREVAQIRGRLMKLVVNEDLPEDADLMVESIKAFVTLVQEYEEEKEKDFEDDVARKRQLYMDIEMLKLLLSQKAKEVDKYTVLHNLLAHKKEKHLPSVGTDSTSAGNNN